LATLPQASAPVGDVSLKGGIYNISRGTIDEKASSAISLERKKLVRRKITGKEKK
jgi:hypothetical protein